MKFAWTFGTQRHVSPRHRGCKNTDQQQPQFHSRAVFRHNHGRTDHQRQLDQHRRRCLLHPVRSFLHIRQQPILLYCFHVHSPFDLQLSFIYIGNCLPRHADDSSAALDSRLEWTCLCDQYALDILCRYFPPQ